MTSATAPTDESTPTRGGLRVTRARRTRQAIQDSALRLALEHGYEAMTVEAVAADAGVSRRTVFNYFPTKIDLVIRAPQAPSREDLDAFITSQGDLLEDLGTLIAASDTRATDDAADFRRLRVLLHENPSLMPTIHARVRLFHSVVHAAIAQRMGADLTDPRVLAASTLASAIQRGAVDLWAGKTPGTGLGGGALCASDGVAAQSAGAEAASGEPGSGDPASGPTPPEPPGEASSAPTASVASVAEAVDIITTSLRELFTAAPLNRKEIA